MEEGGYIKVNGVSLYYWRRGSGPHALLFIPGAVCFLKIAYPHQLDYFGKEGSGFTVVSFDVRGYGESRNVERPKSDALITDAKDGHELMKALSLNEFSVLGSCNGGTASLILAALFPQSVKNVVTFGTRSYITDEDVKMNEEFRNLETWSLQAKDELISVYGSFSSLQNIWSEWLDTFSNYRKINNGDLCTTMLSEISCPTLIIQGGQDRMCPLVHAEYLKSHVKDSCLVVVQHGGHLLHIKLQQEFNEVVEEFLTSRK